MILDETELPDELIEKIFALVEREAGRDAPLSPEDEAMVRKLLATDPAAQAVAANFGLLNTRLDELADVGDVQMPDSLAAIIRKTSS
jgi:anti-sigma factor RsiW